MQPFKTGKGHFHEPGFQSTIAHALVDHDPRILSLAQDVRDRVMGGQRFVMLTDMGFNKLQSKTRKLFILGFTSLIGSPTVTSLKDNSVLWKVTPDSKAAKKHKPTFTETDTEADFHTDSTFRNPLPEKMFSLWSVKVDKTGNGISSLMDGRVIQERLVGTEALEILQHTEFPFNTPAAFTQSGKDEEVVIFNAPILDQVGNETLIRWNEMGITNGVKYGDVNLTSDQEHAIALWKQTLNRRDLSYDFMIPQDAVLFVNNHELLHARSRVGYPKRRLIRVRMDAAPRYTH